MRSTNIECDECGKTLTKAEKTHPPITAGFRFHPGGRYNFDLCKKCGGKLAAALPKCLAKEAAER